MLSIFYTYFIAKIILTLMICVVLILYKKKKIHGLITLPLVILFTVLLVHQFRGPSIVSNVKKYNTFSNLRTSDVAKIKLFENGYVLKEFVKKDRIGNVLELLLKNKHSGEYPDMAIEDFHLSILLKDNESIEFKIIKTDRIGSKVYLLNKHEGNYTEIGVYQNKELVSILNNK